MNIEATSLTLLEAIKALQEHKCTSLELVQAYLERIHKVEPQLHAYLHINEKAIDQAKQADERRKTTPESNLPPLLGVPIAVKDVLSVADMPATAGSRILEGYLPPFHATAVERLCQAGAIIIGKTNTDEFAMGSSTENSGYGVTHNPWDLKRVPGGSSGGSAAAVAARLTPAALGTDTGGSIRQPASYCGVCGLKPTYGRVSRYGLIAYGSSLDCVGPFARDVRDIALLLSIMAGYDEKDATSAVEDMPSITFEGEQNPLPSPLRIGVPEEYFIAGLQPEVEKAVREAIHTFEKLGAVILPISLPHTKYALPVYYIIAPAEASANLARFDGIRYGARCEAEQMWEVFRTTRGSKFGAEVKRRIMLGTYALSAGYYDAYYGQAQKVRTLIKQDFDQAFEKVDLIAAPVAPTTAFRIGEHTNDPLAMYLEDVFTLPANLAGIPGLSFPVGFDSENLPIGIQMMAAHFREDLLLHAAYLYQQHTEWHTYSPPL